MRTDINENFTVTPKDVWKHADRKLALNKEHVTIINTGDRKRYIVGESDATKARQK